MHGVSQVVSLTLLDFKESLNFWNNLSNSFRLWCAQSHEPAVTYFINKLFTYIKNKKSYY